jgi:muramoyltetrapeptide carboxypeptidase LdcA involved in peptidoglycan recycling
MESIKPNRLTPGDTIAVLTPSWGGPHSFPHIFDHGLKILQEEFGLNIKEYPTTRMSAKALYLEPEARAADVNAAFADPTVKAIFTSIGGSESVRILPYLDAETIRSYPKILMGFSDISTLLVYGRLQGLITFNGPAVMAGFAQLGRWPHEFADHIRTMLFDGPAHYTYQPYTVWSEAYPDWGDPANTGQIYDLRPNHSGWQWLQGAGTARGELFGGCIEVLEFLKATPFWPSSDFWRNKILFFETSEEVPGPQQVQYMLRNYGMQGAYDQAAGLLFGRARGYSEQDKTALKEKILAVVATEFGRPDLPVVVNMDFGHTDPQFIMPLGVQAELDCDHQQFRLVESAVL